MRFAQLPAGRATEITDHLDRGRMSHDVKRLMHPSVCLHTDCTSKNPMRDREQAKQGKPSRESEPEPQTQPMQRERKVSQLETKKTEGDADNPLICRGVD
jgi:hypothetical protein